MKRNPTALDRRMIAAGSILRYLPDLLLYPLRPAPLLVILVLGSGLWLFSASLFGLFFVVMFSTGLLQYCLRVLEQTAVGHGDPPALGSDEALYFDSRLARLLLLLALFAAIIHAASLLDPALGWLISLLGWLVLPASMLLLALSDSVSFALAPARLLRVALFSGPLYLLLAAGLAAGFKFGLAPSLQAGNEGFRAELLVFNLPTLLRWGTLLASAYAAVLFAHLLGYIAYHHREELGLMVEVDRQDLDRQDGVDPATRRRRLLDQLDQLLRARRDADALAQLRHAARELDHEGQLELLDDLATHELWPLVRDQGLRCIEAQLAAKRGELAVVTALRLRAHFSSFHTPLASTWLELCRAAARHRPLDGFLPLAELAASYYPDAAERVDIALLQAHVHAERRNDDASAIKALEQVEHFRQHPRYRQLSGLLLALRGS